MLVIMLPLSEAICNNITALLLSGTSVARIHTATGVSAGTVSKICSQYCPNLPKNPAGHPSKLTAANVHDALHLITFQKAENATQVTRTLRDITNQSLSSQTVHRHLKEGRGQEEKVIVEEKVYAGQV
jgi:hypothetical protein